MINRRELMVRGGMAGGVLLLGGLAEACKPKNLSTWVTIIVSDFAEMKPLLSELGLGQATLNKISGLIDTATRVAKDFDEAYRAGQFANAVTLFNSLGGLVTQIAGELGATDNRIVKLALVSIQVARIAIASLLQSQAQSSPVAMKRTIGAGSATAEIQRLASVNVDALLKALP